MIQEAPNEFGRAGGAPRLLRDLELDWATCFLLNDRCSMPHLCVTEQMSSNRSLTRSEARSLLSMARLKMTRSRRDRAISRRTRMDQTCFGSRGFFWPMSNPLFQGRWSLPTGRTSMGLLRRPALRVALSRAHYL